MMGFGFVGLLIVSGVAVALLGGGIPQLARTLGQGTGSGSDRGSSAKSILDERLARGEIDSAEYDKIRAEIER